MHYDKRARQSGWPGLAAYLAFVVYGSLVPLDYRPLPPGEAWQRFQDIPFLSLGIGSRADWVANGVLYLPLGFLFMRAMAGVAAPLAWVLAVALCAAVATGVEFAQLLFPPRTVSQNDLMAEVIGSALGATLALVLGRWVGRLREAWDAGGQHLRHRLLEVYAVLYLALCFFPYDLLLSPQELADKFHSALWSGFLVLQDRGLALSLLQLGVEVGLVLPVGLLLAWRLRVTPHAAAGWGLVLGAFIEVGQFFVASGVSQGASVLSRSAGLALGAWLAPLLAQGGVEGVREGLRRFALPLLCIYLPLLLFASGWFRGPWQGLDAAAATWAEVRLLPFYYHYYTSEAVALASLGSVALMYMPLAALGWAWHSKPAAVLGLVGVVALVVETGKLFVGGLKPDPTNLLIAVVAAVLALRLGALASRSALPSARSTPPRSSATPASPAALAPETPSRGAPVVGAAGPKVWPALLFLPVAAAWAWTFPAFALPLLALLAACAAAVWWRPLWVLAVVPAALPVLDLAPWSGRFYWTEFDLLLGVCLAVAAFRTPAPPSSAPRPPGVTLAFVVLGISLAVSTVRALLPWPAIDDNSFSSYYSAFNALRIVKGALWAWVFAIVFRRLSHEGDGRVRVFGTGMIAGLAFAVAWVLWERVTFVGLFDFASDYRVTGPISAMHKGGAYIECYLAVASAFALDRVFTARRIWSRALALSLLVGAGYAVMVTYSRNGYAAYAAVLVLGLALQLGAAAGRRQRLGAALAGIGVLVLVAAAAVPVLGGSFARERLAQSTRDLAVRQAHWADALRLQEGGPWTALFGEGIGRFPEAHYWRSQEPQRAASYALLREGERRFLRLGSGATLYIEQVLSQAPGETWTLAADLRSPQAATSLGVSLCRKSMLTSAGCVHATVSAAGAPGTWQRAQVQLDTTTLRGAARLGGPQLKLSLATPARGPAIDVDRLSLQDSRGTELLANGDFAAGMDRWFFATDIDPPWHIHSLPVAVWFDQGAFGAVAWVLLLGVCTASGVGLWRRRRAAAPAALVAVAAFLISGSLNTLIDEPRFLGLLLICLWLATLASSTAGPAPALRQPVPRPPGPAPAPAP
jgi:hypothetical protein